MRDLVKTVMGLFREVDFGLAGEPLQAMFAIFRKGPRQGDYDGRKICLRSTACKCRDGVLWKAKLIGEPGKRVPLNLICSGRSAPVGQLRVEHGHKRIGNNRGRHHTRVIEAEVARMSDLDLPLSQHLLNVSDHFIERNRLLEIVT